MEACALEEEHELLTTAERESVGCMLTGLYGIPWVVDAQELRSEYGECVDPSVNEPELVFALTQSETIVHPLQDVAKTRLCCVDVEFGPERVSGILDTGAQRSMLNTSSFERVKSQVPPLIQPLPGAPGFVGASGERLTVHGEVRRCPVRLNGYEYHVNLVVADLGTVNIILGMDFMLAYDSDISLGLSTVSFRAGAMNNTRNEEGPDWFQCVWVTPVD